MYEACNLMYNISMSKEKLSEEPGFHDELDAMMKELAEGPNSQLNLEGARSLEEIKSKIQDSDLNTEAREKLLALINRKPKGPTLSSPGDIADDYRRQDEQPETGQNLDEEV